MTGIRSSWSGLLDAAAMPVTATAIIVSGLRANARYDCVRKEAHVMGCSMVSTKFLFGVRCIGRI
jgi:hypothetical protein